MLTAALCSGAMSLQLFQAITDHYGELSIAEKLLTIEVHLSINSVTDCL